MRAESGNIGRAEVTLHFVSRGCKPRKTGLRLNCETLRRESCFVAQSVGEVMVLEHNGLENKEIDL